MLKRWAGAAFETVQNVTFSAYTDEDAAAETLVKSHAYLANSSGFVAARCSADSDEYLRGYVGATDDPAGAGTLIASAEGHTDDLQIAIFFSVGEGQYFEITNTGNTAVILWQSVGTLAKPTDQD